MSHEELISLTTNKTFELAKDFIVEGLSVKLNSFENAIKSELKIKTEPRTYFEPVKKQETKDGQAKPPGQEVPPAGSSLNPSGAPQTQFGNYYERKLAEER